MRDGCPNCENTLQLRGNTDAIQECTSQVFEGLIAVRDPTASWVARWQRLDNYVPGTYATKVTGSVGISSWLLLPITRSLLANYLGCLQLPDYIIGSLEDAGIKYVPYVAFHDKPLFISMLILLSFRRDGSTGEEEA